MELLDQELIQLAGDIRAEQLARPLQIGRLGDVVPPIAPNEAASVSVMLSLQSVTIAQAFPSPGNPYTINRSSAVLTPAKATPSDPAPTIRRSIVVTRNR